MAMTAGSNLPCGIAGLEKGRSCKAHSLIGPWRLSASGDPSRRDNWSRTTRWASLLDDRVLNVVLVLVTAILGPVLTERFAPRLAKI